MYEDKILQIIPAPADMLAWYRCEQTGADFCLRVVCLALMEDQSGERHVRPMDICQGDGSISPVSTETSDILGISFEHQEIPLPESAYE